ncbi:putative sodium/metabolite cotransporter BASS1 chloroplastic-like, partial [Trifolium medium]|nr:putative sodium/metabolite cotransporter BASS1 chloroplastic-like [Trifolium medium]
MWVGGVLGSGLRLPVRRYRRRFHYGVTMLGMGMTLTLDDLLDALSMPKEVLSGFCLQYS